MVGCKKKKKNNCELITAQVILFAHGHCCVHRSFNDHKIYLTDKIYVSYGLLLTPVFAELNKHSIRCTKPILMINGGPKNRLLHIPRKMNHFAHEKKKQIIINVFTVAFVLEIFVSPFSTCVVRSL